MGAKYWEPRLYQVWHHKQQLGMFDKDAQTKQITKGFDFFHEQQVGAINVHNTYIYVDIKWY